MTFQVKCPWDKWITIVVSLGNTYDVQLDFLILEIYIRNSALYPTVQQQLMEITW